MEYEIVSLPEIRVAGPAARTNNLAPDMAQVVGGLWKRFYEEGIYDALKGQEGEKTLGIYSDYESDHTGDYQIMTACRVPESKALPPGISSAVIPAGRYAKFTKTGELHQVVGAFWSELWNMDLPRAFVCDFEEYQGRDPKEMEVHFYISVKDRV